MATMVAVAVISNMAYGFVAGLAVHYGFQFVRGKPGALGPRPRQH